MHIYDYIIIGSGLTGLTISKKISLETSNILILEQQDVAGGNTRSITMNEQKLNNGLRFFPATDVSEKALNFLNETLGQNTAESTQENLIETYEASGFKRFVGFGEKSPEFYDQLSYYLASEETKLALQPYEWAQILASQLQDKIHTKSIVTKFGFEGLDSEKPVLTHVVVNGSKNLYARNFIFAGPVKELGLLIPDDVLNARAKAKLKKSRAWQSVGLDLAHSTSCDKTNLFVLNGTTDDDIGPCIGRFTGNVSQWTGFIDSESAEDTENIGLVLNKMKRQIRRAFPDMADAIIKERVSVSPVLSGADLKLSANGTLPKVENLWIASPQVNPYPNLLGALMQAKLVLSSLGFMVEDVSSTPATEIETSEEAST
jgi:hypothetical protein